MLTSLLIAFVLATQFKGAYSILALLKTAYDMGTQTDAMSKYKSIVQNLGVFIAAYLGFKFGELFTEGLNQKDDANLRNALDPKTSPHNANWIAHNYNQPGARGELARELHVLHERLKQLSGIVGDPEVSKEFRKANVLTSQERAWTHLQSDPQLLHEFQQSDQKTLKHLSGFLERSTDNLVKAARTVNPLAYGLLFTTFLAVPVIRGVNRWIERNHPEFHGKKVEFFRFPELANTPGNYHGPGNLNAQQRAQNKNPHANLIKDHSFGDGDMEMVPVTVPDLNVVI